MIVLEVLQTVVCGGVLFVGWKYRHILKSLV